MEEQSLSRYVDTCEQELPKATKEDNVLIDWWDWHRAQTQAKTGSQG